MAAVSAGDANSLAEALVGRSYTSAKPYEVSREKLREFATAVGEGNPVFHNAKVAIELGHPDIMAPPTFPIVVTFGVMQQLLADPDLAVDLRRVVHGDQRFNVSRPLYAGDVVNCTTSVSNVRSLGSNVMVSTSSELRSVAEPDVVIVRAEATLLIGAGADSE